MSTSTALLLSLFLIAINGFFVAVELAFVASRRTKLEAMAEDGMTGARAAYLATGNVTKQLFAAQLGITIASLILGFVAEAAVADVIEGLINGVVELPDRLLHGIGFVLSLFLVVFVHTVFGEMVPKNIAIAAPEQVSRILAPIHLVVVTAVRPIIYILNLLARPLLLLAGIRSGDALSEAHTPQELSRMLDDSRESGLVEDQEHALLTGALDFGDLRVRSIMIPRSDIVSIARTETIRSVERTVVEYGHSRLPVVGVDGETIVGFLHAKDLVRLPAAAQNDPLPLELIRRMLQVSIERKLDMALVVASDASVVGMITLEDILEELVGEIYDESDRSS
jgi:CBS domain containing-hemolysin-like protein